MKEVTSPATKKRSCLSAHRSRTGRPCHKWIPWWAGWKPILAPSKRYDSSKQTSTAHARPVSASILRKRVNGVVSRTHWKAKSSAKLLNWGGEAGKSTVCRTRDSATMCAKEPVLSVSWCMVTTTTSCTNGPNSWKPSCSPIAASRKCWSIQSSRGGKTITRSSTSTSTKPGWPRRTYSRSTCSPPSIPFSERTFIPGRSSSTKRQRNWNSPPASHRNTMCGACSMFHRLLTASPTS